MASRLVLPYADIGQGVFPADGALLHVYETGTSTPKDTFTDETLATPNSNPVVSNASGVFPSIWGVEADIVKLVLEDKNANQVWEADPVIYSNSTTPSLTPSDSKLTLQDGIADPDAFLGMLASYYDYAPGNNAGMIFGEWVATGVITPDSGNPAHATLPLVFKQTFGSVISVKQFGAVGDGIADDTASIQASVDRVSTNGGSINVPTGTYIINDTITIDTAVYTTGVIIEGEGRNSIIRQSGAGKDAFHFSTTQFLQNSGFRDLSIITDPVAGHCINIVYGCTTCFISNVDLTCGNPNKHLLFGDWSSFGGGVFDTKFSGGSWYCSQTSISPGVRFICGGTFFNENVFENLRCYYANTAQFFSIATTAPSIWLTNNTWKNINFEVCRGGGFAVDSMKTCNWKNIAFWDAQGAYTNNLIEFVAGAGIESAACTLENVSRNGDTLAASVNDIKISSGQFFNIKDCYTEPSLGPTYDFGDKIITIIGALRGTIDNKANATWFGSQLGSIQFPQTVNGVFLNYYDEGTWTATLVGTGAAPTVPVTTVGSWTRIGRIVAVHADFGSFSSAGGAGNIAITGLPFAPVSPQGVSTVLSTFGVPLVAKTAGTQLQLYDGVTGVLFPFGTVSTYSLSLSSTYTV